MKRLVPCIAVISAIFLLPTRATSQMREKAEGDSLTLQNQDLQKAASDLNYTLILVP